MIEQQYIDIFNNHRELIDDKSAPVINNLREPALQAFAEIGFPTEKEEYYKYFDVSSHFAAEYGLNLNRASIKGNPYFAFKDNIPGLQADVYYMLNDIFHRQFTPVNDYPDGVFVGSLCDFAGLYPSICEKYYGKIANIKEDGTTAFNTMFAQDGFVVYVPENIVVEQPIQLVNILKSNIDMLVNRRILIIAEKNAQVKLIVCDQTEDKSQYLVTQVNEIFADENAVVDYYLFERNSDKVNRVVTTYIDQKESSNVLVNNLTLNCGHSRNNYYITLGGQYAESNICGMVIGGNQQLIDNFVQMNHAKPNCHSNQLFKYVMMDEAKGAFCGKIVVEKDAQKTIAYQNNRNLCVSDTARMYSKPQLEIYADDVKCSHGLTTGQLDEEALFYLRSRGIDEEKARLMLMQAFTADVLEHIRLDGLKELLLNLVEKRLRGEDSKCANCSGCK